MANQNGVEWSIRVGDGSSMVLEPEYENGMKRLWGRLKGLVVRFVIRVWMFLKKAWDLGVDDPSKFFHCLKVGVVLTIVSLFYYLRPLYDGVGGSAIWAVMTVVTIFEYNVGATLYKCLNRICATFLAGFLALGIHWIASHSGHQFEPYIMGMSLFLLASATTFSRFIPVVKARFDYGCTIFLLTYSLVSVSGCVADYFGHDNEKTLEGYKCVLNSKASEESMANFARWEPAHGHFNFRHPWKNYLKIGASSRSCAYCIETLTSCMKSKNQVPESIKNHLESACMNLSSSSSNVIRELATIVSTMRRSVRLNMAIEDMKNAVQDLQNDLKSLPDLLIEPHDHKEKYEPVLEVIPLVSFASLLIETASRIEENM
ncbi:hypothetical protein L1987_76663 [Smallanthus sonchifolius]|uniref:Uncharacterized protein n=1 Tax=Smallanthus sonchifolius TaxID=185202 RepID=A0ACB8Z6U9_9ASTR|nr:hypothetical protein L1987_76663 [Smallanthus sonchifolius]